MKKDKLRRVGGSSFILPPSSSLDDAFTLYLDGEDKGCALALAE
jgi:hypothetical protein